MDCFDIFEFSDSLELSELSAAARAAVVASQDERTRAMQASIDEHHAGLSNTIGEMERRFHDKSTDLDELIEDHHKHFTAVCIRLDKKFTEETGKNADRIENEHRFFNELCQGLGKDLNDKTGDLDDRLTAASAKFRCIEQA